MSGSLARGDVEEGPATDAPQARPTRACVDPLAPVERVAISEEVASAVRHDLRNKLSGIRNAAFFLKRRTRDTEVWTADPRVEQFFTIIDETVVTATATLDGGLRLSHLFARAVSRVTARACVELAASCARAPESVTFAIDAGEGEIEVDRAEVALAIRCLLENAAEAIAGNGRVEVSARRADGKLVIVVTDQGTGIPEADRESIFSAFHTTKAGHAGLGLNIARRVAERYRGALTLLPTASGASFALALPLVAGAAPETGR